VPEELVPKPSAYYYKPHAAHAGFAAPGKKEADNGKVDASKVAPTVAVQRDGEGDVEMNAATAPGT